MDASRPQIKGPIRIPVGDLARADLEKIFPGLTAAQYQALRAGTPIPPSKAYENGLIRDAGYEILHLLAAIKAHHEPLPPVSAILVVSDPRRQRLARSAVNQFVAQNYPNKRLVIVNACGSAITNVPHAQIVELPVEPAPLGQLRNIGLAAVSDGWVVPCWDDDDHYAASLLTCLMLSRQKYRAVMLTHQVRVNMLDGTSFLYHRPAGIPSTMLVPATAARFDDELEQGETQAFLSKHWPSVSVIPNEAFPENVLSIAIYHGNNQTAAAEFMDNRFDGRVSLEPAEATYLQHVASKVMRRRTPHATDASIPDDLPLELRADG